MRKRTVAKVLALGLVLALLVITMIRIEVTIGRVESLLREIHDPLVNVDNRLSNLSGSLNTVETELAEIGLTVNRIDGRLQILEPINSSINATSSVVTDTIEEMRRWVDKRLNILGLLLLAFAWYFKS